MKEDPPLDAKCRDKFLVQAVPISKDLDFSNVTAIWQNVEKTAKSSIQEKKIRVNFLPATGASQTPTQQVNGTVRLILPHSLTRTRIDGHTIRAPLMTLRLQLTTRLNPPSALLHKAQRATRPRKPLVLHPIALRHSQNAPVLQHLLPPAP